jgi:hypothetical protein
MGKSTPSQAFCIFRGGLGLAAAVLMIASSAKAETPVQGTPVPLLRIAKDVKNPSPSDVCGFEIVVDSVGTIQGMRMVCEDGGVTPISTERAKAPPLGAPLKEVHAKIGWVKIDCVVASLKIFDGASNGFHPSQGGPAQVLYQGNCRSQNKWKILNLNVVHAGKKWEVYDGDRKLVNCLSIDQGRWGIDEIRASYAPECSEPVRKRVVN